MTDWRRRGFWLVSAALALLAVGGTRSGGTHGLLQAAAGPLVTGQAVTELAPFDRLMTSFVERHAIPGAALAVVHKGNLVLARGYGWADVKLETPVRPNSLFRIASLSKPITAVAVLQLIEQGKLAFDARPFQLLGFLKEGNDRAMDPRLNDVTVLELLRHMGGFDRDKSSDPMFQSVNIARDLGIQPPAGPNAIIRYMSRRPLDFDPGNGYAYSNFGYCVLGRVIEHAAGCSYQEYVKRNVLVPLGIQDMRIGHTLRSGRVTGEVTYYAEKSVRRPSVMPPPGRSVEPPYGAWYLEAMDAHGGWIASAVDMARFASAWGNPLGNRILSRQSQQTMFSRPPGRAGFSPDGVPKASYYGCGWLVRPTSDGGANQWHTGSLPGTATLMVRRHDGLCWVVLFNTRYDPEGGSLTAKIDPLLHRAADAVRHWPDHDLFATYQQAPIK